MDDQDDPLARSRAHRLRAIVDELVPRMRRVNPDMPDELFLDMIEDMAERRLVDEEFDRNG